MIQFFVPRPKAEPSAVARAGRVLYWTGCAIAVLIFAVPFAYGDRPELGTILGVAAFSALFYMGGRGLRYILAAE